jgi:copper chaperone
MTTERFSVQNVKCAGCVQSVREGLGALPGVVSVEVEIAGGRVTVEGEGLARDVLAAKLRELGYPPLGG